MVFMEQKFFRLEFQSWLKCDYNRQIAIELALFACGDKSMRLSIRSTFFLFSPFTTQDYYRTPVLVSLHLSVAEKSEK